MIFIAKDTPKSVIDLLEKIKFEAVPEQQRPQYIQEIISLANKVGIQKRGTKLRADEVMINTKIKGVDQRLMDMFNEYDFSRINKMVLIAGLSLAKSKLKELNLLR